jgi:hypothetical protein
MGWHGVLCRVRAGCWWGVGVMRKFKMGSMTIETNIKGFNPPAILNRMRKLKPGLAEKVLKGEMTVEEAEAQ